MTKDIARPFSNEVARQDQRAVFNPFSDVNERAVEKVANVMVRVQLALANPRNLYEVQQKLESEFSRPSLAEIAMYAYPRGGKTVTGPSINAAKAMARCMRNIEYGFEELETDYTRHYTKVRAYAYDIENNVPVERIFLVEHKRTTKQGTTILTDPRDISEMIANQAQRKVRACILQLVPQDLIDFAMEVRNATMEQSVNLGDPHIIESLVTAFQRFGVNKEMIEARIGRNVSAILPSQYTDMRTIYVSLRDGVGKVEDFFDLNLSDAAKVAQKATKPKQVEAKQADPVIRQAQAEAPHAEPAVAEATDEEEAMARMWEDGGYSEEPEF